MSEKPPKLKWFLVQYRQWQTGIIRAKHTEEANTIYTKYLPKVLRTTLEYGEHRSNRERELESGIDLLECKVVKLNSFQFVAITQPNGFTFDWLFLVD